MVVFKKIILLVILCFSILACTTGLGDVVDLEAPEITVTKMISGDSEPQVSFDTTVYTKKNVTFYGTATDNIKVSRVYAEIKWVGETTYKYVGTAELNGEEWILPVSFTNEGACWIQFVCEDDRKNFGVKSSKPVTLFVDENAPVGNAWYIDRMINGYQYNLQSLESLKNIITLDPELEQPANIDVAQNGEFTICSSFNDASGIKSTSINIFDESGNKVNPTPIECESGNSAYAPRFVINKTNANLADSGLHYYEVRYTAEDTVINPGSNRVEDMIINDNDVSIGWFIWWPEKDNPRCSIINMENRKLNLHVGDSFNVTVFDDDALDGEVVCKLGSEPSVKYTVKENEREVNVVLTAPSEPQTTKLTVSAKDKYGKTLSITDIELQITSDTVPNLILITPEANQVPDVSGENANIHFSGIALDLVGSTYLEFVWVPNAIPNKKEMAAKWLSQIGRNSTSHDDVKPGSTQPVRITNGSGEFAGLKLFSAKLTEAGTQSLFKKHEFDFDISLLNTFPEEEIKKDKYFFARLTRKDGNYSETDFKLAADNLKPEIVPVNPGGNMAIIDMVTDLTIQFYGKKDNGLLMDTTKYKVCYSGETEPLTGSYNSTKGFYEVKIQKEKLEEFNTKRENPKFKFYAEDKLGNSVENDYQFIISTLPTIKSVSSGSPDNCKKGDSILFNVSFSKSVVCNTDAKLKLTNIKNETTGVKTSDIVYAKYKSGSGSTTLIFEYIVQDGDLSDEVQVYKANGGPITGIAAGVHLDVLTDANNLQGNRNKTNKNAITIDGISPKVKAFSISTDADSKNIVNSVSYLKAGRTITATIETNEPVTVQGSPKVVLQTNNGNLYLDWQSIEGNVLKFSKKITNDDLNGSLYYSSDSYISNFEVITDSYGNPLDVVARGRSSTDTQIVIDTVAPLTPKISSTTAADNNSDGILKGGKYRTALTFTVTTNSPEITEYSIDAGGTWKTYTIPVQIENDASLIARRSDFAGNVSEYSKQINVEISNSFPIYSVECTNVDGKYNSKSNSELKFKVYFAKPVNIPSNSEAYISLSGANPEDIVSSGAKATLDSTSKGKTAVTEATFTYKVKETDQFTLKVVENAVHLDRIVDQFGFGQGTKTLKTAYVRSNVRCDSVIPTILSMKPAGTEKTLTNGKKSYTNGKQIVLQFSEPVKIATGKIYLRQTEGWAIPPMFTGTEFTTVLNAVKKANITNVGESRLTGSQILYLDGMEDSEWLFGSEVGVPNDIYHGTGQYTGPYKKTSQGINDSGEPDLSVKYVLDYDVDIWNSADSKKTKFGQTFASGNENAHSKTSNQSRAGKVVVNEGANTITTDNIRYVLEQVHLHERYMNVNSSSVVVSSDGKTVTLNFPAGLLGDIELPAGREWELVIEKGAFMDEAGNYFGANQNGTVDKTSEQFILVKDGENDSFLSSGVAKPVIRVDRYSYNIGIYQPKMDNGEIVTEMINTIGTGEKATTTPTGLVRVRIDCETKGAQIRYTKSDSSKSNSNVPGTAQFTHNGANSYYTKTTLALPANPNGSSTNGNQKLEFLGGNGSYTQSCKQYYKADATFEGETSAIEKEGIFQTVLNINDPKKPNNGSIADYGNGYKDVSIRGTTGFAGEPSISPFPLRDSQVGSPFLKRTYQIANKQYYWISYEILLESSFSMYAWCQKWWKNNNCYNWGRNWGIMEPGEFTRVDGLMHWEN